jgi:hypothetical protein
MVNVVYLCGLLCAVYFAALNLYMLTVTTV